ncbi:hypothetical protein E4634_01505 [Mangrovimicrobium sediminis]|uniref:Uncharacterized protein n=1 Tax=Mangrovimicrobium sediminis TaxID=2562682 RepID=A0A4Z0MA44_9GAMM|nr:hypothetical protein [Haliea sp. SAOS-164]TGD76248.1 hypothetical protein E4634_01505 [Haliea sp. SAOS-164]
MNTRTLNRLSSWLAGAGALATASLCIYMAQPWGDNPAYRSGSDYLNLALLTLWALSPHIFILWRARGRNQRGVSTFTMLLSAVLACLGGTLLLGQTALLSKDAQAGLAVLVIPVYQWLLIASLAAINWIYRVIFAKQDSSTRVRQGRQD